MPSPVMLRRQNAQHFDVGSSQQSEVPTERYLGSPVNQGNPGDDGNGSDGPSDPDDGASESGESDGLAVFLPSDSDSDVTMSPKERLKVRIARIYLEWKDMRDYNASFGEPCPTWNDYKIDGLVQTGYSFRAGKWVKTGHATRSPYKPLRQLQPQHAGPSSKKPAAKVVKKSMSKVATSSAPSPVKSLKAMKAKSRGAGSSTDTPSPKTPMKAMKGKPATPKTPMKKVRKSKVMIGSKSPSTPKSKMQTSRKAAASSPSKKMKWVRLSLEPDPAREVQMAWDCIGMLN